MSSSAEPFVRDCYSVPVHDEITAHDLPIAGALPSQLTGIYLRNGPNPRPGSPYPFIAGDGMVHGIRLEAGQARWYRNRCVKTRRDAGIRGGRSSNTHVFAHAGRILSFVEVALPIELNRQLETVGPVDFGGIETAFTAHGKIDPGTGELIAFGYQFANPHLTLYRIDCSGQVVERRPIDLGTPCLMHDFALTEQYAIFFDTPTSMAQDWGGGGLTFRWQEVRATRIGVVPPREARAAGSRWFDARACQLSHTLNAFEQDGRIIVDGIRTNRFPAEIAADPPTVYRWEIDLTRNLVREGAMDHHPVEFPALMNGATAARIDMPIPSSTAILALRARRKVHYCAATTSRRARRSRRILASAMCPASQCSCRSLQTPLRMTGGCLRFAMTASWIGATSAYSTPTSSTANRWQSCSCRDACPSGCTGAGLRADSGFLFRAAELWWRFA